MPWFSINITRGFLLESIGVSNFGFVIRVLSFMIVPFSVDLDKVYLGCDAPSPGGPLTTRQPAETLVNVG